jgi:molybdenum cofactor synthesis domain-containing protein
MAALATYGVTELDVFRRVRVAAIVTGSEVVDSSAPLKPWQIRDANGPALEALFGHVTWIDWRNSRHVIDDLTLIHSAIVKALNDCDVLLLSGGVSVGDYDYVRDAIVGAGGNIVFHRLPIRPGKPLLGATGASGQTIFGLPGNPLSVMVTARRFVAPVLRRRAGLANATEFERSMHITNGDNRSLHLHWFRLARQMTSHEVELVFERNSGDLGGAARSDGFIEVPVNNSQAGPWPFYSWEI